MTQTVNIGVIGVGAFMARQHLPNMLRNPAIRIHTLCDVDEVLLAQRAVEFLPRRTTQRAEEVFADPEIQAVMIGTRANLHAAFVQMAARHGKGVFVEKPMAMNYEQVRDVLAAVRESKIQVGVGFNRRFAPIMVEARQLFRQCRRGAANVMYRIVDDHRIRPRYIFDMNNGGGHLLQEGCHVFDLLAWFLDEEPVEVFAAGPIETDNAVIVKYSGGSIATLLCGGKGGLFYPKELMEAFSGWTTLAMDQFYELRVDGPGQKLLKTFSLDPKSELSPDEPNMTGYYRASFSQRPEHDVTDLGEGNRLHRLRVDKGHAQAIAAFAAALTGEGSYSADAIAGARATVCALKAYESIKTNRPAAIRPSEYGMEDNRK